MGRSRRATVLVITVGYVLVWAAAAAVWISLAFAWRGDFWSGLAVAFLAAFAALFVGHVVWATRTATALRPYGRPWRTALTVIAAPLALVLVVIARNESLVPWQLWPVAVVAVPAAGATWASARR